MDKSQQQFLELLRSGLWGTEPDAGLFSGGADWTGILDIADEQTVLGIVADGFTRLMDGGKLPLEARPSRKTMFAAARALLKTEQRNKEMDEAAGKISGYLSDNGIRAFMVKGQGVARAYLEPARRSAGDIDFLMDADNYRRAKSVLDPGSRFAWTEKPKEMHYALEKGDVDIELHGAIDVVISKQMSADLRKWTWWMLSPDGAGMTWHTEHGDILLPPHNFHAVYIFSHLYNHFIIDGLGLRQICDWARYLYTYHESIDVEKLVSDVRSLGLETGWRVFAAVAADVLGCPPEVIPLYSEGLGKKAEKVLGSAFITGNFGHKQEAERGEEGLFMRKIHSFGLSIGRMSRCLSLFPKDTMTAFWNYLTNGAVRAAKGEM